MRVTLRDGNNLMSGVTTDNNVGNSTVQTQEMSNEEYCAFWCLEIPNCVAYQHAPNELGSENGVCSIFRAT